MSKEAMSDPRREGAEVSRPKKRTTRKGRTSRGGKTGSTKMPGARKPVDTLIRFKFGEVFPPGDPLSEWVATIALAFNDIAYVHAQFDDAYSKPAYEYLYLLRISLGHFHEAAKFLDETKSIPEVKSYLNSLPKRARDLHADCLRRYCERLGVLGPIRNLSAFHYPELKVKPGSNRKRPMERVLDGLADDYGEFFKAASGTVGDSRGLFADDFAGRLFAHGAKSDADLIAAHQEIKEAITSFMRFANFALDEWWVRAGKRGAKFTSRPGRPVSYATLEKEARARSAEGR